MKGRFARFWLSTVASATTAAARRRALTLDWAGGLAVGGDSGLLLGKGDPAKSLLLQVIRHEEPDMKMPKGGAKLSPRVIADF